MRNIVIMGYLERVFIMALTSFFVTPKGDESICMVFNAIMIGMND